MCSHLTGDAQGCGHGEDYDKIAEKFCARLGVSKRQAKDKLAILKIKANQSIYRQAEGITRLVGGAFPTLADADMQALALKRLRAFKPTY